MINETVKYWAEKALLPMKFDYGIADCCGAHHGLLLDPVGICFFLSKEPVTEVIAAPNSVGFNVWNESFKTEQGTWINMRGVSSIPGEEDERVRIGAGTRHDNYPAGKSLADTNITSLYLNGVGGYLGKNLIPNTKFGNAQVSVSTKDRLETIFATWKGKYIITIQKDQDMMYHETFLGEIKDQEAYRSPKFQNRGYNLEKDYLQCVIYKF